LSPGDLAGYATFASFRESIVAYAQAGSLAEAIRGSKTICSCWNFMEILVFAGDRRFAFRHGDTI
jgi:hypothetical protein